MKKYFDWQFGYEMKGSKVEITNNGRTYKKIGDHSWYRIFGSRAWKKGIHKWTLKIEKYTSSD